MVSLKSKVSFINKNPKKKSTKKLNPFDFHINKIKHKVLGQNVKSGQGLPGMSRNKAISKRMKTLLQEYKLKDKNNQFIDQRIGERNFGMTEDDRIMARFSAERKRMFNNKTMFNLSHEVVLTHLGQTLSEVERFQDTRSDDEEESEESGALRGKFVSSAHFGGGMFTKNKQDRESLIDELINESKKRKSERQYIKEETLKATEQLDEDWNSLVLIISPKTKDSTDIPKRLVNPQEKDTYDVVMRQLKFESHGQPSQRLKTGEEIAKEDKEQLERFEKERLKHTREFETAKHDNHQSADDIIDCEATYKVYNIKEYSDYELGESVSSSGSDVEMEDKYINIEGNEPDSKYSKLQKNEIERLSLLSDKNQLKVKNSKKRKRTPIEKDQSEDEIEDTKNNEDSVEFLEELNVDEERLFLADSASESSDEVCSMDNLIDLMPLLHENRVMNELQTDKISVEVKHGSRSKIKTTRPKDHCKTEAPFQSDLNLPYVLDVPNSYKLFKDLLKNYSIEQQSVIFERLIKSNHPSLEPGNKEKMLNLAEYMVQSLSEGMVTWKALPALALHLSTLKVFNSEECLKILVGSIVTKLENFNSTFTSVANVKFLALYILLSLKPQGMEVLLPVSKPALNLACKILSQSDLIYPHHITTSLLCCYLLLQETKSSSTVYTNAITFLCNCVKIATSKSISGKTNQNVSEKKIESQLTYEDLPINTTGNLKICLPDKEDKVVTGDSQILYCSVVLLSGFVKVYQKLSQSKILFKSIHCHLSQFNADTYPQSIKQEIVELQNVLQVLHSSKLPFLVKAAQKPKALRLYTPFFHNVTVGKSHKGLPTEQLQDQKLLHKYKHEMKGAMRELRRDRLFLANVKLSEQTRSDEVRMKKVKEIFGSAAEQQGELRKLKQLNL